MQSTLNQKKDTGATQSSSKIGKKAGELVNRFSRLIGLICICLILALTSPNFLQAQNLLNVLRQAAFLAILSCGMTLVLLTGGIDLSVGGIAALTSCLAARLLTTNQPLGNVIGGIVLALAVGLFCGLINGVLVAKVKLPPFIASFGVMQIARGAVLLFIGGNIIYGFHPGFRFLGAGVFWGIPAPIVIAVITVIFFWLLSVRTNFGRAVYAVGANAKAAWLSGINTQKTLIMVYAVNGILAAFTGLMYISRLNAAEPGFGGDLQMQAIAATVIGGTTFAGGVGGIGGTVVGALIMILIGNGMNLHGISSLWQQALTGAIIIFAVLADLISQSKK
jgi:ribose transport system permease protein